MAKKFTVEFSIGQGPDQARSRAETAFKKPASQLGLRLKRNAANELVYEPSWGFPFLVNTWRHIDGQKASVRFEPNDAGGSQVKISGAVTGGRLAEAEKPEFWTTELGGPDGA